MAEQIDKYQLEVWEASDLVAGGLEQAYKLYRQAEPARRRPISQEIIRASLQARPMAALRIAVEV